ncbi:DNA topoisomerase IB [Belliella kenyensis]|uniref:DNA topoisomerase IB n=1 Tax=Belliella kenyensis TaxID=1472724 RepID=A0ABV8EJZ7_9BACT|nr:DNA topoisomerase IB [Belliella kenyensis]MCH7400331.1 DNA topoisomerase IB [Belliella kenyensis]MDN3604651.1 DNA topoisomerase IB [Belliella kenyensis]
MSPKYRYTEEDSLCLKRVKRGRGFSYLDENGNKIEDEKKLKRIKNLVIPPMWTEVHICRFDDGHIQATGRDLKGRKQYIYHSEWEKIRQEEKFQRMYEFGNKLPKMRKKAHQDLKKRKWNKSKILALMVSILDETGIRIGNTHYAKQNQTYGLTTLRRKHMEVDGERLLLSFKGKSNKEREVSIEDVSIINHVKRVSELPGYELFKYKDEDGKIQSIDSHDVLLYIRENMGEEFTCKDFRTWVGSRLAIELFQDAIDHQKEFPRKKLETILVRMVADELGNTPTICKGYYIHPVILNKVDIGEFPLKNPFRKTNSPTSLDHSEKLLMKLLEK